MGELDDEVAVDEDRNKFSTTNRIDSTAMSPNTSIREDTKSRH